MFFGGKDITTVDIGTNSIKIVRMKKKNEELLIQNIGKKTLPIDTIKDGEIIDVSLVTNKLEGLFNEMGFRPDNVITSVSNKNLVIRNIEVPKMSKDELKEALKWEVEDYLPFPVEYTSIDYLVVEENEDNLKVLLVAVSDKVIDSFLYPLKKLEIIPAVVNVQPMALISLLQYQGLCQDINAIIDIGASNTSITVGDSRNIYLSRTIDTGGEEFTRLLMEEKHMDYNEAEEYKRESGLEEELSSNENSDFTVDFALSQVAGGGVDGGFLLSIANNLANEINRSLDYYTMKNRDNPINRIFVTGGGIKLKGLKDIIEEEVEQELDIIDPFSGAVINHIDFSKEDFGVAIGLGISEVLNDES
ncbi:MAG: type IV pilus assembly protein PilM [Halothermotrichaceae bacterium]